MVQKIKLVLLGLCLFIAGYMREYTFLNVNSRLWALKHPEDPWELTSALSPLNYLSHMELYIAKFGLVFLFALVFLGLTVLMVREIFGKKKYALYCTYFYASVMAVAFSIFGIGYITGTWGQAYTLSRYLIQFVESPLATFFLIPAFFLLERSQDYTNNTGAA